MKQIVGLGFLLYSERLTAIIPLKLPRCEQLERENCIEHFDLIDCDAAFSFCLNGLAAPYINAGMVIPQSSAA